MSVDDVARISGIGPRSFPADFPPVLTSPGRGTRVQAGRRASHDRVGRIGWQRGYVRHLVLVDSAAALLAGAAAVAVVASSGADAFPYLPAVTALPVAVVLSMALHRAYEPRFLGVGSEEFRRVLTAGVGLLAAVATLAWVLQLSLARSFVVVALPLATLLTLLARYRARRRLHRQRADGRCTQKVVAVGHAGAVEDMVRQMRRASYHGMQVVAACVPSGSQEPELIELGVPVLGDFNAVVDTVELLGADTVAVMTCPEMDGAALRRLGWSLERTDAELVVAPALQEMVGPRVAIRPVCGLPLLHVERPELGGVRRGVKAVVDRSLAAAALVALLPMLLAVALAIRLDSRGPVLFRQTRVGRSGRPFTMLKFRTMVVTAEDMLLDLRASNEGNAVLFKMRRDPRVTRVGRFLRRYSIDELPQLLNVLAGRMSLVGPRPPLPAEAELYGDDVRRRLLVKPGLTGLWQINGRSDLDWDESVRLDLRYVENWSIAFDVMILWKTASAVLRGRGAY